MGYKAHEGEIKGLKGKEILIFYFVFIQFLQHNNKKSNKGLTNRNDPNERKNEMKWAIKNRKREWQNKKTNEI